MSPTIFGKFHSHDNSADSQKIVTKTKLTEINSHLMIRNELTNVRFHKSKDDGKESS